MPGQTVGWLVGWLDAVGGLFFLPYVSSHSLGRVHFECFSNPGDPSLPTSNTRSCCFCCCSVPILQPSFPLKQFNLAGSLHLERMNEQCVQLVECKQTVRLASCLAVRFFFFVPPHPAIFSSPDCSGHGGWVVKNGHKKTNN